MSATIKIIAQANGETTYVGAKAKYSNAKNCIDFLYEQGIIPDRYKNKHWETALKLSQKNGYITVEMVRGTLKYDEPFSYRNQTENNQTETNQTQNQTMETTTEVETTTEQPQQLTKQQLEQQFNDANGNNPLAGLAKMIAQYVEPNYEWAAAEINKLVQQAIATMKPDRTEIVVNNEVKATIGRTHKQFKDILRMASAKVNIWLTGEAGSGKSTIAEQVAEALSLQFYTLPCAGDLGKHEIVGYMDANSGYAPTPFRTAYEHGGVFIFEEIDSASPEVLLVVNTALANGGMYFPDGKYVKRHESFICLAAANTWGNGASRAYVGRQSIDAASLDRFVQYEVVYDEELELEISGNREWTRRIQRIRAVLKQNNQRIIVSPRASISGAKLLAAGFTEAQVLEMVVFKGCSEEQRNIINSAN